MYRVVLFIMRCAMLAPVSRASAEAMSVNRIFDGIQSGISGNRARDYVMRLWMHDK